MVKQYYIYKAPTYGWGYLTFGEAYIFIKVKQAPPMLLSVGHILMPDLFNKNIYKIFPRSNPNYIEPNNECKELVIYGTNLESSLNKKVYTQIIRNMINIPNNILYILVGVILSDGYIEHSSKKDLENSIFVQKNNIPASREYPQPTRSPFTIVKGEPAGYIEFNYNYAYKGGYGAYAPNGLLTKHNCRLRFKQNIKHSEYV